MKEAARRMVWFALPVTTIVVVLGWTTGIRDFMHGSLIAVCVFALLPFVIIGALLATVLLASLFISIVVAMGHADVDHLFFADRLPPWVGKGIRAYYRFLNRHRGSAWFGIPVGLLLGGLCLWGVLAIVVLPRETRTLELMALAQREVEQAYAERGEYPQADLAGHYLAQSEAWVKAGAVGESTELLDAFGRPLAYEARGKWKWQSYRFSSLGFDGVPSYDDLCVTGATRGQTMLDLANLVVSLQPFFETAKKPWAEKLSGVQSARCSDAATSEGKGR